MPARTTQRNATMLRQICELFPAHLVPSLGREHGVMARTFSCWSHVIAHLFGHFTRAVGLNDICDSLAIHSTPLRAIRGATPPKRNTFSHANRTRPAQMAEQLYWRMLGHLSRVQPSFATGQIKRGYLRRFKAAIHAVDSTTIQLVLNCMDWAKHRRRKAAAKCHMVLSLNSMLPRFAAIDTAKIHDAQKAREICAPLKSGEIAIFDKAYVDFGHLFDLNERGVFWVSRAKDNMSYRTLKKRKPTDRRILEDREIALKGAKSKSAYPKRLRLVRTLVEIEGEDREMVFLTNNLEWSAWSVAELYRARWDIETFFKEIKQTVQLVDFVGHNRNAVLWQIWMGLLTHLLMRFLAHMSRWAHSFTRLFTLCRAALWQRFVLLDFFKGYGTAKRRFRLGARPEYLYLPGLESFAFEPMGQPRARKRNRKSAYEEIMQCEFAAAR